MGLVAGDIANPDEKYSSVHEIENNPSLPFPMRRRKRRTFCHRQTVQANRINSTTTKCYTLHARSVHSPPPTCVEAHQSRYVDLKVLQTDSYQYYQLSAFASLAHLGPPIHQRHRPFTYLVSNAFRRSFHPIPPHSLLIPLSTFSSLAKTTALP